MVSIVGTQGVKRSDPSKSRICAAIEAARRRFAGITGYKPRRDPAAIGKDSFAARQWLADIRRAFQINVRRGFFRVKKQVPPGRSPRLENILG